MKLPLHTVLERYPAPATSFAFVCSTEDRCQKLKGAIAAFYKQKKVFECRNEGYAFNNLSVLENIYVQKSYFSSRKRREQLQRCKALLERFGLELNPHTHVSELSEEEKHLVELLRAAVSQPEVLLLSKASALMGYYYFDVYCELLDYFKQQNTIVVLITPRWEDTIRICEKVAVTAGHSDQFTIITVDKIRQNPHKLIYALSNYAPDDPRLSHGNLLSSINALFQYSEQIEQSKSLEDSLSQFTAKACQDLGALCCMIYIRDDAGRILRFYDRAVVNRQYEMSVSYVNRLIEDAAEVVFDNKADLADVLPSNPEHIESLIFYPIAISSHKIGLLQIAFGKAFLHDEEKTTAIKILCTEIAKMVLSAQLANNNTLIQESNHRIKNNLQTIMGIIYMQKRHLNNHTQQHEEVNRIFDSIISRIQAIAKVHEYLSAYATDDPIPLKSLIATILPLYERPNLTITATIDEVGLDNDRSLYVAMILNELISNSCKHAFADDFSGAAIELECSQEKDDIRLTVRDNGKGLRQIPTPDNTNSVGLSIVNRLLSQMNGRIVYETEPGTCVTIHIPRIKW